MNSNMIRLIVILTLIFIVGIPTISIGSVFQSERKIVDSQSIMDTYYYFKIPIQYRKIMWDLKKKFNIPSNVLYNLPNWESGFNPKCIAYNKGSCDLGIMAINSIYLEEYVRLFWKKKIKFNVFNPYHSIELGFTILYNNFKCTGSWEKAVMVYNAGLKTVISGKTPKSTFKYRDIVMHIDNKVYKLIINNI